MFQNFQATPSNRYPVTLKTLKTLCQKARSLEQMVNSWCDKKRSLLISKDLTSGSSKILVSFFIRRRLLGSVEIDLDLLLERYPFANKIEVTTTPDQEVFNQRRDRLGLYIVSSKNSDLNGQTAAPADSIGELIVSYAMSGYGFAEVKILEAQVETEKKDLPSEVAKYFELKLITINPETKSGWTEQFLINKQELNFFVEFESALARGQIH